MQTASYIVLHYYKNYVTTDYTTSHCLIHAQVSQKHKLSQVCGHSLNVPSRYYPEAAPPSEQEQPNPSFLSEATLRARRHVGEREEGAYLYRATIAGGERDGEDAAPAAGAGRGRGGGSKEVVAAE